MILNILWFSETTTNSVHIKGPTYVKENQNLFINCTSEKVPFGNYAEFHVNGQTYTSLYISNMQCKAGNKEIDCNRGDCQCSPDGRWYSVKYRPDSTNKLITFKCIMKYIDSADESDEMNSTILGKWNFYCKIWEEISVKSREQPIMSLVIKVNVT